MNSPRSAPSSSSPLPARTLIGLREALLSTIRTWLVFRDNALWAFCAGTDLAVSPLEHIDLSSTSGAILEMDRLSSIASSLSRQISEAETVTGQDPPSPQLILRSAVEELLTKETPRFLLSVPDIPGSF